MQFTLAHLLVGVGAAAIGCWLWVCWLNPLLRQMRAYISQVTTCGFLPPPPSPRGVRFLKMLSRVVTFIQVGKIKVVGKENLNAPGPMIVAPNHPHYVDPGIIAIVLDRPARYMAARGVMTFGWGVGGLIAGKCGAFAADLTPGKGGPARLAGVRVLTSRETLVMFPEGWAYLDGKLGPFKKGAVRIAREAARQLDEETYIIPVYLRYGRYPGSWILSLPPPLEYLLVFLCSWLYRRGVTVVIGKPIPASALPGDDAEATEYLKQQIVAIDPGQ